jgi:hypothetical protein
LNMYLCMQSYASSLRVPRVNGDRNHI